MTEPISKDLGTQLREFKKLLDEGIISQEEFDAQKAKLLQGEGKALDSVISDAAKTPTEQGFMSGDPYAAERSDMEKQLSSMGWASCSSGCVNIEPLVVNVILAFFLPLLWIPVALFILAAIVAVIKRSEAQGAIKACPIDAARASLATAKKWTVIKSFVCVALWLTEIMGFLQLVKGATSLAQLLSGA